MSRRLSCWILAASCLGAAACYPTPRIASQWPVASAIGTYSTRDTQIVGLGGVMLDRTEGSRVLPGFLLEQPLQVVGTNRQPLDNTGIWSARFEYRGACPNGRYVVTNPFFYEERVGIVVAEDGTIACDRPVVQIVGAKRGRSWQLDEPLPIRPFRPTPAVVAFEPDAVRRQLVYRGRSAGRIELEYREFRGELDDEAQPATTQQLRYELGPTRTISFHGTDIEVVRATSHDIAFRIVRDDVRATRIEPPPAGYRRDPSNDDDRGRRGDYRFDRQPGRGDYPSYEGDDGGRRPPAPRGEPVF